MKSQQQKEEWIDRVLQSIEGITPADGNPYLYHRVLLKLKSQTQEVISLRAVWMSAAAFVALLVLNVAALKTGINNSGVDQDVSTVVSEYQLNSDPSTVFEN
jgi:hypothetical protein